MPALDRRRSTIRVEEANAFAAGMPNAGIYDPVRASALEALRQLLRCLVGVRIEGRMAIPLSASQIVQIGMDRQHALSELRRPTSILSGPGHEALMMMDRLEQHRLEGIARIQDTKSAVGEAARPVRAH